MIDLSHKDAAVSGSTPVLLGHDELRHVVETALPQTPEQFGERLIKEKWGTDIEPRTDHLVTLHYNYHGHPAQNGIHQGQVASSQSLLQALLANYQTVGDGRFGENLFGLYTPPDIGPTVRIVEKVEEFAYQGSGNHDTYEGIYRQAAPPSYAPSTQRHLRPSDFKRWVWELDLQSLYQAYLDRTWPSDAELLVRKPYALRTSTKAAFVMAAMLQHQENCLSQKGLELAMLAAGLPADQVWETLTGEQLQAAILIPPSVEAGRLKLYRYTAQEVWGFRDRQSARVLLYIPGNSSPLHEFTDSRQLQQWIVGQARVADTKQSLAAHFADEDREDGTFHAGVLTALDGMAIYPMEHRLTKEAGFFNNDGYWEPADYIGFEYPPSKTDPFAQLVLTMKQAAWASVKTIRDDAQVNRDNLSAVIEPIVQWVNRFGPLALFVPGGEGVLALAGLIDAGYGLDQAVNGETASNRSEGVTRTVFGLLNALPLIGAAATLESEGADAAVLTKSEPGPDESRILLPVDPITAPVQSIPVVQTRVSLLRGLGTPVASFSDEVLAQIGKVCVVDDDTLRLMQVGRPPTPLLADTISRFRIDQEVGDVIDRLQTERVHLFNSRYEALQQSENEWVRLFQRQYPGLPKSAVEQMLDRYGVDFTVQPDVAEARQLFKQLDSKARQYQQHVRLNRAYEGLYLRSMVNPESDTLILHSLNNLPGWPRGLRIEVLDGPHYGRVLDRCGPLDVADCRRLFKVGDFYQHFDASTQAIKRTDFCDAIVGVLSEDERSTLQLQSMDQAGDLKLKVGNHALPRAELVLGLGRMDSGLPFEAQGLRGGGFPGTFQAEALTQQMMRLQLKDVYPDFSNVEADEMLQRFGAEAQAHIDRLKQQLLQLNADLTGWIDLVALDIDEMDVPFLALGDVEAAGMTPAQIAAHNVDLLRDTMEYERTTRTELADELTSIWQKWAPQENRVYTDGQFSGFKLDMAFEDYHRLPVLNIRFDEVVELSMRGLSVIEREGLNGFLEAFPNLRTLNLELVDLRLPTINDELESALPLAIPRMRHLTSLNLKSTELTLREDTAGRLCDLVDLEALDLSENPLETAPVVLGMNKLRTLNLRNTRITRCPVGIMDQPYLTLLDLRDNGIARIPQPVLNQAIARNRVLLWGNEITDEDSLLRLVSHRQKTGINLWLSEPGPGYGDAEIWLRESEAAQQAARRLIWQRLAARPHASRFLRTIDGMTLTADFRVDYLALQARVWRLLEDADAFPELVGRLLQDVEMTEADAQNPFAVFSTLEDRARLYRDWVAMGRPFPVDIILTVGGR